MSNRVFVNGRFLHQPIAGVQRYGREVLYEFDRAGYPYQLLEPSSYYSNKLTRHFWEQLRLPRQAKDADALWSPANSGPVYANNHVITLHDIGVFPHPEWFSPSYRLWKRTLIPRMVRQAKKIITVSEFSKKVICRHLNVDPQKILVVYNGVDKKRFKPAETTRIRQVIEKHSLSQPYFFALGSMDPRKNFKGLIEAWNRCVTEESVTGHNLVIAGGSNVNFSKSDFDKSSASVKLLGYVEDDELAPLYSGATGFLFPSLFEGFGLPVIEAMACGTPVLTSDTTALAEITGDAAITVPPENIDSIKEGIMQLLESPSLRNRLIDRGFKRVRQFTWHKAASKIYRYLVE